MKQAFFCLLTILALMSCANPRTPPTDGVLHADPAFTETERAGVQASLDDLAAFSSGTISFRVAFDDPAAPHITRVLSTDPIVKQHEADTAREKRVPSYTVLGWHSKRKGRVFLVVDRATGEDQLRKLTSHELLHFVGLRWPGCEDGGERDCKHSPDPDALMFPNFTGRFLGPADLAFCQASGPCR